MKVEKKQKQFEPVTLTLETQEELDFFTSVFYNVGGKAAVDLFGDTCYIAQQLKSLGGYEERYVSTDGSGLYLKEREYEF